MKALLVGINKYPSSPLQGCVNDVTTMAELLVNNFGFSPDSIRLLVDERATTEAILERLRWLLDDNDCIYFHYSGHGSQIASRNDFSEVDGLTECICPVDFNWSKDKMICDDQFNQLFSRVKSNVKFTWVADCCHSGTLYRNFSSKAKNDIPRFLPPPADLAWRIRCVKNGASKFRDLIGNELNVGFVSGCLDSQYSADTFIDGYYRGALSHFLLEELKANKEVSLVKLIEGVTKKLRNNGYDQCPCVAGNRKDKPFLG